MEEWVEVSIFLSTVASADHVCLMEKVHPLPGEHHSTPGRDLPAFTSTLSVAKHRRLATPFTSNTPDALLPLHPSHLHLH